MAGKLVSYRYTDGRTKPPPEYVVTIGYLRVQEMLDAGAPIEVVEGAEFVTIPDAPPKPEPKPQKAPEAKARDGWPDGYTFEKAKGWVSVVAPDGTPVESTSTSGKFRGEDAAQTAAWLHRGNAA